MRRRYIGSLLLLCIAAGIAYAQQRSLLQTLLSTAQQQSIGLNKLSATEQRNLEGVFASILSSSALGDSAVEYLKSEGWDEVKVLGTKELKLDGDSDAEEYTIAQKGAFTYILEPKTFSSLTPGRYLGKMGFVSCEIINRSGSTVRFWTKETK
jgi:hypothetical protein